MELESTDLGLSDSDVVMGYPKYDAVLGVTITVQDQIEYHKYKSQVLNYDENESTSKNERIFSEFFTNRKD